MEKGATNGGKARERVRESEGKEESSEKLRKKRKERKRKEKVVRQYLCHLSVLHEHTILQVQFPDLTFIEHKSHFQDSDMLLV